MSRIDNQRILDLLRQLRGELHEQRLITDDEYAYLAGLGSQSARRLESYDDVSAKLKEALASRERLTLAINQGQSWSEALDRNDKVKKLLDTASSLIGAIVSSGKITWDFDEQQADPIHNQWRSIARNFLIDAKLNE